MLYPEIEFNVDVKVQTNIMSVNLTTDSLGIARFVSRSKKEAILYFSDNLCNETTLDNIRRLLSLYSVIVISPDVTHPLCHANLVFIHLPDRLYNIDTFMKVEGFKYTLGYGGVAYDLVRSIERSFGLKKVDNVEGELLKSNNSILIRDFDGLGDILMLIPTLKAYANKGYFVDVSIRYPETMQNLPYINKVFNESEEELPKNAQYARYYDLSFKLSAYEKEICKQHRIKATACLAGLNSEEVAVRPEIILSAVEIEKGKTIVKGNPGAYKVALGLFSADSRRGYPKEQLNALMVTLNKYNPHTDFFLLGQRERDMSLVTGCRDLRGTTSIRDMFAVVNACDAVVCIDSSVLHIAGALSKPTILIPATVPGRWRNYPETEMSKKSLYLKKMC